MTEFEAFQRELLLESARTIYFRVQKKFLERAQQLAEEVRTAQKCLDAYEFALKQTAEDELGIVGLHAGFSEKRADAKQALNDAEARYAAHGELSLYSYCESTEGRYNRSLLEILYEHQKDEIVAGALEKKRQLEAANTLQQGIRAEEEKKANCKKQLWHWKRVTDDPELDAELALAIQESCDASRNHFDFDAQLALALEESFGSRP